MKTAMALLGCLLMFVSCAKAEKKEVKLVETSGTLGKDDSNFTLKTKDGEVFSLVFDDMHKDYPELKKALPGWVGKEVIVSHREGFIKIGGDRILLASTAKLKGDSK